MHKPKLNALRGDYHLPEEVKTRFDISKLLKTSANNWVDPEKLIDSYFVNCLMWEENGEDYLTLLSNGLEAFSKSDAENLKTRVYAGEVARYLKDDAVIRKSKFYYRLKATQAEAHRQEVLARLQGDATGAALSNAGAKDLRKRAFEEFFDENEDDQFDEEAAIPPEKNRKTSFSLTKNTVQYEIHTPTSKHFLSPQKPIMQQSDRAQVSEFFDLRLSSDAAPDCSDELKMEYSAHMRDQQTNKSLRETLGNDYLEFMKSLFAINLSDFSKQIFNLEHSMNSTYLDFVKQSYNDLCMIFNGSQDYLNGGERTLFSEFVWIEKKMPNIDHSWLVKKDFVKKDVQLKLLDGIGVMTKNNVNFIMLESSGVVEEIFKHTLEDTIKNLKHGTDSLASILCSYKNCNIETVKKIVVLTGHIIGNKLTIIKYSCGNSQKWSGCEVRSCEVPLTYESRKTSIKLFEVFAYVYLTLKEQEEVYDQLADEKLGLLNVEEKEKAHNSQCFL